MDQSLLTKRNLFIRLIMGMLLASMLVTACGSTAAPAPTAQPAQQEQETGGETAAITTTNDQAPTSSAAKGTLRYGFSVDFDNLNPHRQQRFVMLVYYQLVYDALLAEDADGTLLPGLATEWVQSTDAITFTLREGVVFHDGTPFNAEVAKANLLHALESTYAPIADQLSAVESIDVLDDSHIRLNLSRPDNALLIYLSRFAGMMISPAVLDTEVTTPVGTGPWTLNSEETEPTVRYVFDLFPDFWYPSVQGVERVEILHLPEDAARSNALRSGQIDGARVSTSDARLLETEGYTILSNEANLYGLHILDREGTMVPAFADERVRLALSYAIDRELLAETVFDGYATPITQRSQLGQYGYAEDIADLSYDPERAKQLLAEAGVENLEFQVPSFNQFNKSNQVLAGFFADIGVTMKIEAIAPETLFPRVAQGNWAAALLPINDRHVSEYVGKRVLVDGIFNPFHMLEEDLEALATQAKQFPPDEAEPLWAEIARETAERGNIIHIVAVDSLVAVSPKVNGGSVGTFMPGVLLIRGVTIDD
jgi:peptide/nickel transport system substrate-binding protein